MPDYKELYHILFNAVTDALEALDSGDSALAGQLLREAQLRTEELYVEAE